MSRTVPTLLGYDFGVTALVDDLLCLGNVSFGSLNAVKQVILCMNAPRSVFLNHCCNIISLVQQLRSDQPDLSG